MSRVSAQAGPPTSKNSSYFGISFCTTAIQRKSRNVPLRAASINGATSISAGVFFQNS